MVLFIDINKRLNCLYDLIENNDFGIDGSDAGRRIDPSILSFHSTQPS
jgi:hypothetical protein